MAQRLEREVTGREGELRSGIREESAQDSDLGVRPLHESLYVPSMKPQSTPS